MKIYKIFKINLILIILIGLTISKKNSETFALNKNYFSVPIDEHKYEDSIADIKKNDDNLSDTVSKPISLIATRDSRIINSCYA